MPLRCLDDDSWHFGYVRNWEPQVLTASKRTDHTEISRRRFAETEPATVEPTSRLYRLSKDGVSNTLRAGTDSARGAFTSPRPIHYEWRVYTVFPTGSASTKPNGTERGKSGTPSHLPSLALLPQALSRLSPLSQHAPRHLSTSVTWTSCAWTCPTLPSTGVFRTQSPAATARAARGTGSLSSR